MISFYKNKFTVHDSIGINENIFNGVGIFETIRFHNKKLLFLNEHIDRLISNNIFNFKNLNKKELAHNILEVINHNSLIDGLIKVIFIPIDNSWENFEYYIFERELPYIKEDIVKIIFLSEDKYPIFRFNPLYKSLFYTGNLLAIRDAQKKGAFEPILYNKDSIITEGAMRNIFFIKKNTIHTPSIDLGILNGITRKHIINIAHTLGYKVDNTHINYAVINDMDEAFITSTGIGIIPCKWNNWTSEFKITLKLQNIYNAMIKTE
jgi:branched-subunit amino acid aminotransferase/4-amino-4-deoxychorismate lyase